jgi:hypothetical protein
MITTASFHVHLTDQPDGHLALGVNSARMVGQLRRLSDHAAAVVMASW